MAREKEGYRDQLEVLRAKCAKPEVTVEEAASLAGCSKRAVVRRYPIGWRGSTTARRIPLTELARQMC